MKVHLDAGCLNRLTDNQNQPRIREEAGVVELVLKLVRDGTVQWIASDVLADEIDGNLDLERKFGDRALSEIMRRTPRLPTEPRRSTGVGYGVFDALHLACAEAGRVDVLLTTDDSFFRKASRGDGRPRVAVRNPLSWSQENLP